jgi:hypothetical protein
MVLGRALLQRLRKNSQVSYQGALSGAPISTKMEPALAAVPTSLGTPSLKTAREGQGFPYGVSLPVFKYSCDGTPNASATRLKNANMAVT